MSLVAWAAEWDPQNNNNDISGEAGRGALRGNGKARTLKNRDRPSQHQSSTDGSQLKELKGLVYGEAPGSNTMSASDGLEDFVPHPESAGTERKANRESRQSETQQRPGPSPVCQLDSDGDGPCSVEGFDDLANSRIDDYYARTVPMYQESSIQSTERDVLLAKLNYMIHLLEEQRDERTGHVTEEIILYSFLGIFMIFMVDSFARAGKYVR